MSNNWKPYSKLTRLTSFSRSELENVLRRVRNGFPEGCRVLDVGSGIGRISKFFKSIDCDVSAIDNSPDMVNKTSALGIDCSLMDAKELKFNDKSFDIVITDGLLEHFKNKEDIMKIISEESRVGKTVINIVPRKIKINQIIEKALKVPKEYRRSTNEWIEIHNKFFSNVKHSQLKRLDVFICW